MMDSELPEDTPEDTPGEEVEPGAATPPPEGVTIPVDTPYGANLPIEPAQPAKNTSGNLAGTETATGTATGNTGGSITGENRKSIKVPLPAFLGVAAMVITGTFIAGNALLPRKGGMNQKSEQSSEVERKPGRKSNFVQDLGIYKRENSVDSNFMLNARLEMAKARVWVITGEPGNPKLLQALVRKKRESGIPIYILTGKDTPKRETDKAKEEGFPVYRLTGTIERPYTIIIVDAKLVLDISRDQWVWETSEPEIVKATTDWASKIMTDAKVE